MLAGRLHLDAGQPPAVALARGRSLLDALEDGPSLRVYGAELTAASIVLGAHQHAPHALRSEPLHALALPVLRRRSGGGALWTSPGVLYLALGLSSASVLMACPPGRTLNRNVRGLLAGLRGLGIPAFYFGRDFVSIGAGPAPGAFIAWAEGPDGRVLLECFIAHETSFELPAGLDGYPERATPALGGKPVVTVHASAARPLGADAVLRGLAQGYERAFGVELSQTPPDPQWQQRAAELEPQLRVDPEDARGLCWSAPRPEAIGFVSAGARVDAEGRVSGLAVGGDYFAVDGCGDALAARLLGTLGDAQGVGAAVDAVYAAPGRIEGVRSLASLRDVLLEAIERARAA